MNTPGRWHGPLVCQQDNLNSQNSGSKEHAEQEPKTLVDDTVDKPNHYEQI